MKLIKVSEKHELYLVFYQNVKNVSEIFMVDQVLMAVNKAVHNEMKTRHIHTEILHNLGYSTNISENLHCFGSKDNDDRLLVAGINVSDEEKEELDELVDGERVKELDKAFSNPNVKFAKKIYRIEGNVQDTKKIGKIIISKISTRDV